MSPGRSDVLVLTHPYRFFAGDETAVTAIRDEVGTTEEYVVGVRPCQGHSNMDALIGGGENYDRIVEDRSGYGRLQAEDAADIAAYPAARVGGFDRYQCAGRTRGSIRRAGGDAEIDPAITGSAGAVQHFFSD